MSIQAELAEELKDAMRAKDAPRRDVIRQVETEVATARTAPDFAGEVDDDLYAKVISSYVKRMEKARDEYVDLGERGERMASKLSYEIDYLSRWLRDQLDEQATHELVRDAIAELGVAGDEKAAGRVIGHLMRARGGDLDGSLVNRLVREELASG